MVAGSSSKPFRAEPIGANGRCTRENVARAIAGKSTLGILQTGTGKSVCYQLPARTAYEKARGTYRGNLATWSS